MNLAKEGKIVLEIDDIADIAACQVTNVIRTKEIPKDDDDQRNS